MVDDPKDPRNRADRISAAYEAATKGGKKAEPEQNTGSDMVKRSAPGMHLTPSGSMRQGPDQAAYNERLQAERNKEQQKQKDAKDIADAIRSRSSQEDRQKDKDPER